MVVDCTTEVRNSHRQDSSPQPSLSVARWFLHWHILKRTCASVRRPDPKPDNDIQYSLEQDI